MSQTPKVIPFREMIIQEDEHLIFINKPAHYSSLDDRHGDVFSIIRQAKKARREPSIMPSLRQRNQRYFGAGKKRRGLQGGKYFI